MDTNTLESSFSYNTVYYPDCASVLERSTWDTFAEARAFAIGRYTKKGMQVSICKNYHYKSEARWHSKVVEIVHFKVSKKGFFKEKKTIKIND